jgi:hypothetical protein
VNIDKDDRDVLARLADVLIPNGTDIPSASEADAAGHWLDQVLAARPDLENGLTDLLTIARGRDPREVIADLQANDASAFDVLTELVSGAYFMNPDVQRAIGYDGQGPRPIDPRPDYMEDGLLESVIQRGPIYRPTPEGM